MAKKSSIKVRLVPELKPNSSYFYYVKKPSTGEKAKFKTQVADPLMPILLSIEPVETPFFRPKDPSSLT